MNRRSFLRGLGLTSAVAPFLPPGLAAAQGTAPKRLVIYWSPMGLLHSEWDPQGEGTTFTLRKILEPLERHRKKMLVLRNVDWQSFFKHPMENSHSPACMSLTGVRAVQETNGEQFDADGISVDQFIAQRLNRAGMHDGLVTGMGTYWPHTRIFFRKAREKVTGLNNPVQVFKNLFAGRMPATGGKDYLSLDRQSTIDTVRAQLRTLEARVGSDDRKKIAAHLDHLRTFELRLQAAAKAPVCDPGAGPASEAPSYPAASKLMLEINALALKCDVARVASFCFTGPGGGGNIVYDWLQAEGRHHDLSHGSRPKPGDWQYDSLLKIGRFHAEQLATFLDSLDGITEGTGTMLDNTVVLWTSEHPGNKVGADDHDRHDVPFVLFGSGGGYFKTNRVVDAKGRPHNEVLLSLIHAMGFTDVKTFGDPELCSGPLPGVTG